MPGLWEDVLEVPETESICSQVSESKEKPRSPRCGREPGTGFRRGGRDTDTATTSSLLGRFPICHTARPVWQLHPFPGGYEGAV